MKKDSSHIHSVRGAEMPRDFHVQPTPFHGASSGWNSTNEWTIAGDYTVSQIYTNLAHEYEGVHAFAALRDLTPIPKYKAQGHKVFSFLNKLLTLNVEGREVGESFLAPLCNENGYVIDMVRIIIDSPVTVYISSNIPLLHWLVRNAEVFEVDIDDVTDNFAVLGLYGPRTDDVMAQLDQSYLDDSRRDRWTQLQCRDISFHCLSDQMIGQTSVQIWGKLEDAFVLWERIMRAGRLFGIRPLGENGYDLCRIEAGLIKPNVDFMSPLNAIYGNRPHTPYELNLDGYVEFNGAYFNGKAALLKKRYAQRTQLVGLFINGKRPAIGARIVDKHDTIGIVTSSVYSPRFMSVIGIATILPRYAIEGRDVSLESYQNIELDPQFLERRASVTILPFK